MKYLLGIDVGTGGCKVALYNDCYVKVEAISSKYVSNTSNGGSSEQDPNLWWQYVRDSIRVLTEKYITTPESSIGVIGVSCANAMIPVDSTGKVLRPALMQYDSRSAEILDQVKDISTYIDYPSITGNEPRSSMVSAVLLYWLKEFESEIYEKTYKFLSPAGFIISRLTGEYTMDYSRASTTMLYNFKTRNWSKSACESLGLDINKLPKLYDSNQIVGRITSEASVSTGLSTDIPVTAGIMDSVAAGMAMGVDSENPYFIVLGSVARVGSINKKRYAGSCFLNAYYDRTNWFFSMGTVSGAGSSLEWLRRLLSFKNSDAVHLEMGDLDYEARQSIIGSHGLTYYPYMGGEWAPYWRDHVKGAFVGLQLSHGAGDIIRSMYEGISFSLRENFQIMSNNMEADKPKCMKICGGGTKSHIWPQILADVLGIEILVSAESDLEPLGALVAYDQKKDVHMQFKSFKPDMIASKTYDRLYDTFIATREAIYLKPHRK